MAIKMTPREYIDRANLYAARAHQSLVELNEAIDHQDIRAAVRLAETYGTYLEKMSCAVHESGIWHAKIQTWHGKTLRELGDYYRATLDRLPAMTKRANGRVAAGQASGRKRHRP